MKVILAIPYNPLDEVGGLEIGTLNLAQNLISRGISVLIVTKGQSGMFAGVSILGFSSLFKLCRYLVHNSDNFDIVHWLEIFPGPGEINIQTIASSVLRSLGKKVILMVATSGNLANRHGGKFASALIKSSLDDYVISNPDQIQEFSNLGIELDVSNIIGFGVDASHLFKPVSRSEKIELRERLGLPLDKIICFFIGRFVERKRPDFLLQAWQSLSDLYDRAALVVVGSGMDQHDSIETTVIDLAQRAKQAYFHDITSQPQEYYQAGDILLLPSSREGQPNVLLEAMACGNAVIGSNIAGIRELLLDGVNGLTFKPDDETSFTEAIRRLVNDQNLRFQYGQAARQTMLDQKDWPIVTKQYLDLYQKNGRSLR